MSSCILSEETDVTKFGMIWAGAQKNVAPAGVTIVILREDLIGFAPEKTPVYLDYRIHAEKGSMYNTPPCFSVYVAGEVFRYLLKNGGVKAMHEIDVRKAGKLYDYIDASGFYVAPVVREDRSLMNVVFVTATKRLTRPLSLRQKKEGL